jgi:hypothetical protein
MLDSSQHTVDCTSFQMKGGATTQAIQFSNAKHAIPSPFGGRNSVFRGKYQLEPE